MKNKRWIIIVGMVLILIIFFMKATRMNRSISKDLEVRIPYNLSFEYEDTHGGFFGDGVTLARAEIPEKNIKSLIKASKNKWMRIDSNENLKFIMDMIANYDMNLAKEFKLEGISRGYWIFKDRRGSKEKFIESNEDIDGRSNHYSLGLIGDGNIYYIKFDS